MPGASDHTASSAVLGSMQYSFSYQRRPGVAVGPEVRVNSATYGEQSYPQVAGLSDGGYVVVWQDNGSADGSGWGVFGQRYGAWKWALNLEHATEWEDNLREIEGEFGGSLGIARDLSKNWALGLEFRSQNIFPEYEEWESSALFLGPVVSYHQERWWVALTVLPQIVGWNADESEDGNHNLDLAHNEKISVRFLIGINF